MSYLIAGRIGPFMLVLALVVTGFTLGDLGSSQAQGPLRRLGDRIRARVDTLVPPPPAPRTTPSQAPTGLRAPTGLQPVAPYATPKPQETPLAQPTSPAREPSLALQPTSNDGEVPEAPSIGIEVEEFRYGFGGVRVIGFRSNSQANAAGLRLGDVIVGVEGRPTETIAEVAQSLLPLGIGEPAQLRIVRAETLADTSIAGGQSQIPTEFLNVPLVTRRALSNQIATRPDDGANRQATYNQPPNDATLGLVLGNAAGRQGAVVSNVMPRSPGEVARMQAGDRIVSINGRMVQNADSVSQVLNRSKPGDQLRVQWVRNDELREANVLLAGKDGISPNALANRSPSASTQTDSAPEPAAGSLLNGIGSTLGNWFGNGNKPSAQPETQASREQPASPKPADELPKPDSGTADALTELSGPSILMGTADVSTEPRGIGFDVTRELPDSSGVVDSEELPMPAAVRDPLEFGDEELVQPAAFGDPAMKDGTKVLPIPSVLDGGDSLPTPNSLLAPAASINESRKPALTPFDTATDPPSLGEVTPPPKQPAGLISKEDQTILLLRSEIERLRSRIQQLEK